MKRIGKTDQGGILLEMTATDVQRLQQACEALDQLFDEVDGPAVVVTDEAHRTFEATGTRQTDGSLKVTSIKPVATKVRKSDEGKKACEFCGKMFVPATVKSRMCSKACTDKDWRQRKLAGVKPVSVAKCLNCGRAFERKRKDQTCCSKACRKKVPRGGKPAKVKAVVTPPPAPVHTAAPAPAVSKSDRLSLIRRLAKGGVSVPLFVDRARTSPNLEDISEYQSARRQAGDGMGD
jgi:hypothetical protein